MSSLFKPFSSRVALPKFSLNMKRSLILWLFFFLVLAVVHRIVRKPNSPTPDSPLVVRTFALGRVQPTGYIRSITYPMTYQSSRILKLYVEENDFVRKGSPLFTVEDSSEAFFNMESSKAQLRQQISELKSSEAKMLSSRSLRDFYKDQSTRYTFLARTGAATIEQADEKNTLIKASQQEYISNLQLVEANKAALDSIGWQYRTNRFKSVISTIRAQSDLKVFKIYSRAGESIQNGKHVMDVGESLSMGVLAEVHRIDITNIKLNQSAIISVNGIPGIKWTGKVLKISNQVTQQSINPDDSAAIIANRVFEVLIKLSPDSSFEAQKYNYMEVDVLFGK
jgi:multidrug resistance efflux pump